MRVAIVADPLDNQSAGIHVYTSELVKALVRYDRDNEYILIRQKKGVDFPELKQVVIRSSKIPIGLASLRLFLVLPMVFRRLNVDAVLEPAHFGPFGVPKRAKRITVIHDLTPVIMPRFHRWHSQLLQRVFLKWILRKADLVISNSHSTTHDLHRLYPFTEAKTRTIPLGRDESFAKTQQPEVLEQYGISQPYFISVGTIEPRKNLAALLRAFETFRERGGTAQLILVGGRGWKSKTVFDALGRHKYREDIKVIGFVPRSELPALYSMSLGLVYPSLYEGFGLPVLEAMSCGTPCLLANTSSLPEVGGQAALYFEPGDVTTMAGLMSRLADDKALRDRMSAESLSRSHNFSWKAYVFQFQEALNKSVNRS
jgi:glycosyltransferase involved in cell wall biosynthesis